LIDCLCLNLELELLFDRGVGPVLQYSYSELPNITEM